MTRRFEADLEAVARTAAQWCGEPLLHDGEDAAVALAPGSVRRQALDSVMDQVDRGELAPDYEWRRDYALVATGFSYSARARVVQARAANEVLVATQDVRRGGSAALDLAWVACGRVDAFYEVPLKPWDTAAGELLVREAGGAVSALPPIDDEADSGVLAAAPGLHDHLRRIVSQALYPPRTTS